MAATPFSTLNKRPMDHSCQLKLLFSLLATSVLIACTGETGTAESDTGALPAAPVTSYFFDATVPTGLVFEHQTFASEERFLPEIVGAGVALLDYDNDGDLDVYFVQGGHPVSHQASNKHGNQLFRNDLEKHSLASAMHFTNVSESAGVQDFGYGMGVASADYDNDGDTDIYVTNFGHNVLYQNNGDGTFADVTKRSKTDDPRWSASASFADFDHDGWLDLFVTNYVADSVKKNRPCDNLSGEPDYCSPTVYPGTTDSLFRNRGDGTFEDISAASGITSAAGAGLGVIAADFDQDGNLDFFVANDQSANFLWHNLGNKMFEENGLISGSAYNGHGMAEASMGVTAADYDGDGDDDLFMTHLNTQTNTLYVNDGRGNFVDGTNKARLDSASLLFTGFGANWIDVDNDTDLDLFIANGAVIMESAQTDHSDFPYAQRNQLFINDSNGRYTEWRDAPDGALEVPGVSRGAAVGDIDNDGDIDIVVSNGNGPAQLLINQHARSPRWLGIKLTGTESARDGSGARVAVQRKNAAPLWRRAHSDGSFLSANDPRVLVGFDADELINDVGPVGVIWPSGTRELWHDLPQGRYVELVEGSGDEWPVQ